MYRISPLNSKKFASNAQPAGDLNKTDQKSECFLHQKMTVLN